MIFIILVWFNLHFGEAKSVLMLLVQNVTYKLSELSAFIRQNTSMLKLPLQKKFVGCAAIRFGGYHLL